MYPRIIARRTVGPPAYPFIWSNRHVRVRDYCWCRRTWSKFSSGEQRSHRVRLSVHCVQRNDMGTGCLVWLFSL